MDLSFPLSIKEALPFEFSSILNCAIVFPKLNSHSHKKNQNLLLFTFQLPTTLPSLKNVLYSA